MGFLNRLLGIKQDKSDSLARGSNNAANNPILECRPNSVLKLSLVGPELLDFEFLIEMVHEHNIGENYYWLEYEGKNLSSGKTLSFEVDMDRGLNLSLCGLREPLRLHQINLSPDILEDIDTSGRGQLTYEGMVYFYDDSDEVCVYLNGNANNQSWYYYWDFISSDHKTVLTVERRGRNDYIVLISEMLAENQVSVVTA